MLLSSLYLKQVSIAALTDTVIGRCPALIHIFWFLTIWSHNIPGCVCAALSFKDAAGGRYFRRRVVFASLSFYLKDFWRGTKTIPHNEDDWKRLNYNFFVYKPIIPRAFSNTTSPHCEIRMSVTLISFVPLSCLVTKSFWESISYTLGTLKMSFLSFSSIFISRRWTILNLSLNFGRQVTNWMVAE